MVINIVDNLAAVITSLKPSRGPASGGLRVKASLHATIFMFIPHKLISLQQ